MSKETVVQYSYISKTNKKWLAKQSLEFDQPVSTLMDEILTAVRNDRKPKFTTRVRAAVARLAKSKTKKRAKIKALDKPKKKAKKTTKKGGKSARNNAKTKANAKTETQTQRV